VVFTLLRGLRARDSPSHARTKAPSLPGLRTEFRETELLGHVVAGAATRDIARLMFVTEHTVQDHLKSIFAKTATRTRRALLARVLGT